ncbi:ABC transporter substrate-binding protein, partial [Vibrio parahaemolyticus]|uniref:ABC transporter substrate-binding protein n=1 Tax=Vibrio parahaemolyticus TaxID=670 RepID=UPI00146F1CA3
SPDPSSRELIAYLHTRYPDAKPTLVPYQKGSSALLQGEADAIATYGTDDAYQLQRQGLPYRLLRPIDSEIDFYGNILFTSERELQMHPDRVLAFHQASLKGWRYAMVHQEEVFNWYGDHR